MQNTSTQVQSRVFKVVTDGGESLNYDDLEDYLKNYDDQDCVPSHHTYGILIEYKNIRPAGCSHIESGFITTEYGWDDLNDALAQMKADQAEWSDHIRTESNPSIFI